MNRSLLIIPILLMASFILPGLTSAQELVLDTQETVKAKVVEVLNQEERVISGTDTKTTYQSIRVVILSGVQSGKEVVVDNDYLNLETGDIFYLVHTTNSLDGRDYYSVSEPYRIPVLLFFITIFIICVAVFGGMQGIRGLIALVFSFLFIFYLLLPGILNGYSPLLISIGVSSLIIILGSYITHGFNKTTSSAVLGMIITILITGTLAYFSVHFARLSGFGNDEAVYLNFNSRGSIDLVGILLGGIMIGLLGVLYDAAIGQAVAVEELGHKDLNLSRNDIFRKAIRMGREHIGALVNTLAIAYVGASLPLFLLFYSSGADFLITINREIFSAEIIRMIIGSIGLILTVPITTLVSIFILTSKDKKI